MGSKAPKSVILAWSRDHFLAVLGLIRSQPQQMVLICLHNIQITYMQILIYCVGIPKSYVIGSKSRKTVILDWSRDHFLRFMVLLRTVASTDRPDFFA